MSRLIPNPTEVFRRIDAVLEQVGGVLPRVDTTLASVDATLTTVEGTLADATEVLSEVRDLLTGLRAELDLLQEVPRLVAQLDDVHHLVTALAAQQGIEAPKRSTSKPGARAAGSKAKAKP